jgi:1-acyl-sn-glycerol-3-phosphate acyltransferase
MILARSLAFAIWFYAMTIVLSLAGPLIGMRDRRTAVAHAKLWGRLVLSGLRVLCGITWEVTGREHLPESGAALIASQHQSAFETFVWLLLVPDPTYVLKAELARIPLVGAIMRRSGMIVVDRKAGAVAMRKMLDEAAAAVADGRQIIIFPEGTRVAPGARAKLHPGVVGIAARAGLPVIPATVDSGRHWARRALMKYPGVVHIAILPPIAAGTPRGVVMARLDAAFAGSSPGAADPGDKSVGSTPSQFAGEPSALP